MIVTTANTVRTDGLNRFSRYSGVVNTFDLSRNGMKTQIRIAKVATFAHSYSETHTPYTIAAPTIPMN